MVITLNLIETPAEIAKSTEFKESYGTVLDSLKVEDQEEGISFTRYYYPFYMIRRLLYVIILVVPIQYPRLQLLLIPICVSFPVFYNFSQNEDLSPKDGRIFAVLYAIYRTYK